MLILYLVPDLNDPALRRRVAMFEAGGAKVRLIGFHRKTSVVPIYGVESIDLGQTSDGRLIARAMATLRTAALAGRLRSHVEGADVIVARNLEMLAVAVRIRSSGSSIPLIYESLDIHRLLLGSGLAGRLLRALEGQLSRSASLLLTSSPAFVQNYFNPISSVHLPVMLVENKVFLGEPSKIIPSPCRNREEPWRIGWFGAIRCLKSFSILSRLTRALDGKVEVIVRGRPTEAVFPDFEALVAVEPYIRFEGAYRNPEDLADIYGRVDFAWVIDFFEEGKNSEWLLPNRLYEGGWGGAIPLSLARTATGKWLAAHDVGVTFGDPIYASVYAYFRKISAAELSEQRRRLNAVDRVAWLCSREECQSIVSNLTTDLNDSVY